MVKKLFAKKSEYSKEQLQGLGYKTDGRSSREKPGKGKQKMLLDSTKLLLDNQSDDAANPYEAERRIDNNVYQMFSEDTGQSKNK